MKNFLKERVAYFVTLTTYSLFVVAGIVTIIIGPFVASGPEQIGDAMRMAFALLACATFILFTGSVVHCDQHEA